jgi:hypothetical protein
MARVIQMVPAAPGMYAMLGRHESKTGNHTEYRLIVLWVLLQTGEATQEIIGLTAEDIASGEIAHSGYKDYTTSVPKDSAEVKIVR